MLCLMLKVWTIKQFFQVSWWILSLPFFSSKVFICFFISVSFPKEYDWGGGGGCWGLEVTVGSNLGGATCKGGLVDAAGSVCFCFFFLIKPS